MRDPDRVLCSWALNDTNQVRLTVRDAKSPVYSVRRWYMGDDGIWYPTRVGFSFGADQAKTLLDALRAELKVTG